MPEPADRASVVPAVVLAGGKAKPALEAATGVSNRALMPVDGRPMLSYIVDALAACPTIGRVVVVGDVPDSGAYLRVADGGGFVDNMYAGLDAAGDAPFVAIATSDIPFVTADAVDDLVTRGLPLAADLVYPIVHVEDCLRRFPGIRRTSLGLREGRFTGGNAVLVRPEFMRGHRERIADAYAARKSPMRLATMLGLGVVARLALTMAGSRRALGVAELETAVSRLLGGTARALVSPYPEIATDIDRVEDLQALRHAAADG